jgi:hypothetical protein
MTKQNEPVVAKASEVVDAAIAEVLALRGQGAVIGYAPAGAGKSHAIATAVERARKAKLRLAVATPTNEQAFALVSDLSRRLARTRQSVTFLHSARVSFPEELREDNTVTTTDSSEGERADVLVATLSKLGDAFARQDLGQRDLLLVDEAFQANAVHYYGVGALADRHLLMGDSGQLAPFSTAPEADRWRGLGEDPLQTAVEVLVRNHPRTGRHYLPITWRLDPRAVPVVRSFYPKHTFSAAVLPGVRRLEFERSTGRGRARMEDAALELAAREGWAHLELPAACVLSADPETVNVLVRMVQRLFERGAVAMCERRTRPEPLGGGDVAIAVSHNDQKDLLRAALQAAGHPDVVVDTANKLQGLTFEVVFVWHPLAGLAEGDDFHLDPGRLCVMLTRHRQACIVVGRAGDRALVEGIPPATPSFLGWDVKTSLDGWYAHESVFRTLEPFRLSTR